MRSEAKDLIVGVALGALLGLLITLSQTHVVRDVVLVLTALLAAFFGLSKLDGQLGLKPGRLGGFCIGCLVAGSAGLRMKEIRWFTSPEQRQREELTDWLTAQQVDRARIQQLLLAREYAVAVGFVPQWLTARDTALQPDAAPTQDQSSDPSLAFDKETLRNLELARAYRSQIGMVPSHLLERPLEDRLRSLTHALESIDKLVDGRLRSDLKGKIIEKSILADEKDPVLSSLASQGVNAATPQMAGPQGPLVAVPEHTIPTCFEIKQRRFGEKGRVQHYSQWGQPWEGWVQEVQQEHPEDVARQEEELRRKTEAYVCP